MQHAALTQVCHQQHMTIRLGSVIKGVGLLGEPVQSSIGPGKDFVQKKVLGTDSRSGIGLERVIKEMRLWDSMSLVPEGHAADELQG